MREVATLGYVVVSAADLDAWSDFGQHALGLQLAQRDDSAVRFRMDERAWRLSIEQGDDAGLAALGFEVSSRAGLAQLRDRLEAAGVAAKEAPEVAAQRGVDTLLRASDPTGIPLEFFCGATTDSQPFVSPTAARFVTGEQGFGHAVVSVDDVDEATAFYVDLLRFRLTDTISFAGMELYFTSPSPRHHSLAYSAPRPGAPGGQLQHIMVEVDDLDVVGRAQDYCLDHEVPMLALLGKHGNDHMVSFYCASPSGLVVEYGWGGRQIDDATHQQGHYDAAHVWGHRPTSLKNMEQELRRTAEAAQA